MSGSKIAVSQRTGGGDRALAMRLTWQALWLALAMGLLVAAAAPVGPLLFGAMGASAEVAAEADAYFSVRLLAAPAVFLTGGASAWFHGRGDTRTPMVATVLGNVVNVVLDPLFIFGWGPVPALGMGGAALATDIGLASGAAFLLVRVLPAILGARSRPDGSLLAETWRLGSPNGLRWVLDVGAVAVFASILAGVSDADLAAHVIVVRIISVSFLPGYAVAEAAGVLIGQSVGARRYGLARQAWRSATLVAVGIMAACGLVFVALPGPLVAIFGAEPAVVDIAVRLMFVAAGFQVLDAVAMVGISSLNGAGDTRITMWVGVGISWVVKLPVAWALAVPLGLGAPGAWLGLTAELVVLAAICLGRVRGEAWLAGRLQSPPTSADAATAPAK